jgi:hypothetical protein
VETHLETAPAMKLATQMHDGERERRTRMMKRKKSSSHRRYGATASKKVGRVLHEQKRGRLRSGKSKRKVTSRKQAIAIGLSQARKSGAKVPEKSMGG